MVYAHKKIMTSPGGSRCCFYKRLRWPVMLAFVTISQALAQRVLSLDQCMRIAFENNLGVRSAEAAVRSAQLAQNEIGRSALPLVKFEGKALNAPYSDRFGYDPALTDGGQFSAQVGVQESLFDGGARSLRASQLEIDVDRFHTERRRAERDLRFDVAIAFLDVLQAEGEVILQRQRVGELSDYLTLANRMFRGGGASYTDVLKTELGFESAQLALRKTLQGYVVAKISLAAAMGSPNDTAFAVAGALERPDSAAVDSILQRTAGDSVNNLDLRIADFSLRRSMFDVDIARTERLPSISLTGDVGFLTSGDNLRLSSDRRASMVGYSVGIAVENLLFNWGATDLRVQQRQLDADNAQLSYERQRRVLATDAGRLRGQMENAIAQLHSISRTLKLAQDNYALTKAQYAGGGTTALEVLSAEQLLSENRLVDLQTRADLQRLFAKFEQLYAQ